jgi:hypothetical protein
MTRRTIAGSNPLSVIVIVMKNWPTRLEMVLLEQDVLQTLRSIAEQTEHVAPGLAEPAVKYWPAGHMVLFGSAVEQHW